jgi:hypothetical protein
MIRSSAGPTTRPDGELPPSGAVGDAMGRILGASSYALVVAVVVMVTPLEAGRSDRDGGERSMKWEGGNGFVGVERKRRQE